MELKQEIIHMYLIQLMVIYYLCLMIYAQTAEFFKCPIEYIDERPDEAYNILGWKSLIELEEGINDVL